MPRLSGRCLRPTALDATPGPSGAKASDQKTDEGEKRAKMASSRGEARSDDPAICKQRKSAVFGVDSVYRSGAPYGIRTRVTAVKGRCPRPLDEGRAGRGDI
jgi:hypothetical protein